jgi:integrase
MPFHNLRHLNATLLLEAGIHPKVVQERLGHSSITMTLDRYSHVSRDLQAAAALALDAALRGDGEDD